MPRKKLPLRHGVQRGWDGDTSGFESSAHIVLCFALRLCRLVSVNDHNREQKGVDEQQERDDIIFQL